MRAEVGGCCQGELVVLFVGEMARGAVVMVLLEFVDG